MAFRYCYYFMEYNCHPETCDHEKHYRYAVYKVGPNTHGFGPYKYTPNRTLFYTDSAQEAEEYLKQYGRNNYGLRDPFMRS